MDARKVKKFVLNNLAYVIFGYAGNIICFAFRTAEGKDISDKILPALTNLGTAFAHILPSFNPIDLLFGVVVGVAMKFIMKMRAANRKKFRQGTEYGSAVWGEQKDIEPYMDLKDKDNNVILTQTEYLTMGKPSSPKYARNKNILVIGGSGSGKTRFFVKPNLMQMHSSYIVTDPKGTVLIECGKMLEQGRPVKDDNGRISYQPYRIKVFNTIDFGKSMHYNPFAYISKKNKEKDILKFVDVLIKNTQSSQQNGGDDFWVKAEKLLYTAYIAMIFTINPPAEQNFETLIEMINSSECREDDETFKNASNGFRPNRSAENAVAQCCRLMQIQNLHYVVDIDIKGFFDNVNHGKLIRQIWSLGIQDKKLICIIKAMLKVEIIMPDGSVVKPTKGTPQGGILSPLLSNIVLNELDWWIASQWENMPTHTKYQTMENKQGTVIKSHIYRALRTSRLKGACGQKVGH